MPYALLLALVLLPQIALAQSAQALLTNTIVFINTTLLPFLLGMSFLFLVINAIRFFVLGSTNQESRENAKNLALYSLLGFTLILTLWGIVNLLNASLGLAGVRQPCPDYNPDCNAPRTSPRPQARPGDLLGQPLLPSDPGTPQAGGGSLVNPSPGNIPNDPSSGSLPSDPTSGVGGFGSGAITSPIAQGVPTTNGDYSDVGESALDTIFAARESQTVAYDVLAEIVNQPGYPDATRIELAMAYNEAGLISSSDLATIINDINQIRVANDTLSLETTSITPPADLVNAVSLLENDIRSIERTLQDDVFANDPDTASLRLQMVIDTDTYSTPEREENAAGLVQAVGTTVGGATADALATELDQMFTSETRLLDELSRVVVN